MSFKSVIIVVDDVGHSRKLYEGVLGLKVIEDHGVYNVGFENGLSLYQRELFRNISTVASSRRTEINSVLYFEYGDVYEIEEKLRGVAELEFIHPTVEQPWGQLVCRVYDPDGHILEIAEEMAVCVRRLKRKNLSNAEIAEKVGYPVERVEEILNR